MKEFRLDLVRGLQEQVINNVLAGEANIPRVIPGDLPLMYDIAERTVYDCVVEDWRDARMTRFGTGQDGLVYYFENDAAFAAHPALYVDRFRPLLKNRTRLYFRE